MKPKMTVSKMGRPTKLDEALKQKARDYILATNISIQTLLPTIEGLAIKLEVNRDTLYDWAKKDKDFSDILKDLMQLQAEKLIQNVLVGRYNPLITKLLLSKHGYIEKQEVDTIHTGTVSFINNVPRPKLTNVIEHDDD